MGYSSSHFRDWVSFSPLRRALRYKSSDNRDCQMSQSITTSRSEPERRFATGLTPDAAADPKRESAFKEDGAAGPECRSQEVCECGNIFMPDSIFCRKCGKKRPQVEACACGNIFMADAIFCRKCGTRRQSKDVNATCPRVKPSELNIDILEVEVECAQQPQSNRSAGSEPCPDTCLQVDTPSPRRPNPEWTPTGSEIGEWIRHLPEWTPTGSEIGEWRPICGAAFGRPKTGMTVAPRPLTGSVGEALQDWAHERVSACRADAPSPSRATAQALARELPNSICSPVRRRTLHES